MTLLTETLSVMNRHDKSPSDVKWVGSSKAWCTWEDFAGLADVDYSSGYGSAQVATDLLIVFSGGEYMSRGEYDGSEWWDFHRTPQQPSEYKVPERVVGGMWRGLYEDEYAD